MLLEQIREYVRTHHRNIRLGALLGSDDLVVSCNDDQEVCLDLPGRGFLLMKYRRELEEAAKHILSRSVTLKFPV